MGERSSVMSCKELSSDIKRTCFERRPILIKIVKKIDQMERGFFWIFNLSFSSSIARIRKSYIQRLVYEQLMSKWVPWIISQNCLVINYSKRAYRVKGATQGAISRFPLEPNHERDIWIILLVWRIIHCPKKMIVHATRPLGSVPIDFLITYINADQPA